MNALGDFTNTSNATDYDGLKNLKQLAGYREPLDGKSNLRTGFFSSRSIDLRTTGEIIVAPRSFFGRLFSWLVPYRGSASGADYHLRAQLKLKIQKELSASGIGDEAAKHIVKQVVSESPLRAVTRRDLRQMISMAEETKEKQSDLSNNAQKGNAINNKSRSSSNASTASISAASDKSDNDSVNTITEDDTITEDGDNQVTTDTWKDVSSSQSGILQEAETLLQSSRSLLAQVVFDPKEVSGLRAQIQSQQQEIETMQTKIQGQNGKQPNVSLLQTLSTQLGEQRDHLIVKEKMLSQYLARDPFSDKNVLYPRKIYAEAAKQVLDKKLEERKNPLKCAQTAGLAQPGTVGEVLTNDNNPDVDFGNLFDAWYKNKLEAYDTASLDKHSQEPSFYLNKSNPKNPLVLYSAKRVAQEVQGLLKEANISETISKQDIQDAAATVMNQYLDWEVVRQDMVFSLGEKTKTYAQISTPLSKTKTAVGAELRVEKIGGIIPSVCNNGRAPINARMTQLYQTEWVTDSINGKRKENMTLLHERQQHGINDHFAIQDPHKRHVANVSSMKQLIRSGAEADSAFIQDAINNSNQQHQLFYINTNLTTPTWTPRGNKNNEEAYSRHQGAAMNAVEGPQEFSVLNPQQSDKQSSEPVSVALDVTCIDFRFPVNYAISYVTEDKRALDPGMLFAWPALKAHNEKEFQKLFGSLQPGDSIGGILGPTYEKLRNEVIKGNKNAGAIKREINLQVKYIREMFQSEEYKRAGNDRFKMPRHIDLLVNAFRRASELVDNHKIRVVNAGGCMSGKDREGVANAENEAAVIVQDLGGSVKPGRRLSNQEQVIYDHCMTGVIANTRQVTGIGGSKNAQEIANQMSDPHAKTYAQGGSKFVLA